MSSEFIGAKILVVDDEVETCRLLRAFLESENFKVEVAHNGEHALDAVDTFQPGCILMDIRMPRMNGLEAMKAIKYNQPDIEIIMITGVTTIQMAEECHHAGAFGYLTKPLDLDLLLQELRRALERRQKEVVRLEEQRSAAREKLKLKSLATLLNEELFEALLLPLDLLCGVAPGLLIHSLNVGFLAGEMAEELRIPQLRLCRIAGWFHDFGKLCLPNDDSPHWDAHAAAASRFYKRYPIFGEDMIRSRFHLPGLWRAIRHQCECVDGTGFPDNLQANDIPIESRIVAVANALDEELSRRGIRNMEFDLRESSVAQTTIPLKAGKEFDPLVVAAAKRVARRLSKNPPLEAVVKINRLQNGMVLSRDIYARDGRLIFPRSKSLHVGDILRLVAFMDADFLATDEIKIRERAAVFGSPQSQIAG